MDADDSRRNESLLDVDAAGDLDDLLARLVLVQDVEQVVDRLGGPFGMEVDGRRSGKDGKSHRRRDGKTEATERHLLANRHVIVVGVARSRGRDAAHLLILEDERATVMVLVGRDPRQALVRRRVRVVEQTLDVVVLLNRATLRQKNAS
jgi:hypothetical protein